MILQTYYRQNHYKPTYVLRSAVSLFLEIPFFIAAYRFLSGLELIKACPSGRSPTSAPPTADRHRRRAHQPPAHHHDAVNLVSCIIFTKAQRPRRRSSCT